MLAVLLALPVALVLLVLRGGSLRRVAEAPWKGIWLVFVAGLAPVPLSVWATPDDRGAWLPFLLTEAAYLTVVLWCVLNRWAGWPVLLLGLGTLLNVTVIAANEGAMPMDGEGFETHLYRPEQPGDRLLCRASGRKRCASSSRTL